MKVGASPGIVDRGVLRLLTCGSVDDGKSSLIGRLLLDLNLVPNDHLRALEKDSRRWGTAGNEPDPALLLDGLEAEQAQGITIDVAYRYFQSRQRAFIVADAPGHEQYTRNMATGASHSDAAVLLIDATKGMLTQTRRHCRIAAQFGIRHVIVAVNKCDLVDFSSDVFRRIEREVLDFAGTLGFRTMSAVPISARCGDNVVSRSGRTEWYRGAPLLELLESLDVEGARQGDPGRFLVQWVCRTSDFRGLAGVVTQGRFACGDVVQVAGGDRAATIKRFVDMAEDREHAYAGEARMLVLADDMDVDRGDVLCEPRSPVELADQFAGHILSFDPHAMIPGRSYQMKLGARTVPATITALKHIIDVNTGAHLAGRQLDMNELGFCNFSLSSPVPLEPFDKSRDHGSFILIDRLSNNTVAAGTVEFPLRRATNLYAQRLQIGKAARTAIKGHGPGVLWLTGLSAAGKSTIANLVDAKLNALGCHTYLIDGDNIRHGLNRDLGFTEIDRVENVRRTSEVARLFVDAGIIVIVSLISPYRLERLSARERCEPGEFIEIFVDAPIEVCRQRDPKGLYAKAALGQIKNFTGVDEPYEAPIDPELRLDTVASDADGLADMVIEELRRRRVIR
jgi:bifunctional enzyme CysN/CysC